MQKIENILFVAAHDGPNETAFDRVAVLAENNEARLTVVKEIDADLVVMGAVNHTGNPGLFVGNTPESIFYPPQLFDSCRQTISGHLGQK